MFWLNAEDISYLCYNVLHPEEEVSMASTTMSIRLDSEEKALISSYAETFGFSVSDFMRKAALERIEDELDLRIWDEAKAEYDADPITIPASEIAKKYL